MRQWWSLVLAAVLATAVGAQEGNPGGPVAQPEGPAAEAPKEPPAWKMPEKDAKKFEDLIEQYLSGPAKERAEALKKIDKFIEKPVDGHSMLEDVEAIVGMANRARAANPKLKKGQIQEQAVAPDVHGFPSIGTVKYWLYVPKDYNADRLWPLLFCIPDQKLHGDAKKYVENWVSNSPAVAQSFLVVAPQAHAKGAEWTSPESLARAMISLRHAAGTFSVDAKDAGPATDYMRVFIEGEDEASVIAARFAEAFAGAVLHGADGRAGGPNVARAGQLSGMPAFCVVSPKAKGQREFAQALLARNPAGVVVEDESLAGNPTAIGLWMEKLPQRPAQPRMIEYSIHDGSFQRHHWINVLDFDASVEPAASFSATADRAKNEVLIEVEGVSRFELFLSDAIADLSKPVRIVVSEGDKEYPFFASKDGRDTLTRDLGTMLAELLDSNQPWRAYTVKLLVDVRELRERAAQAPAPEGDAGKPAGDMAKPAGDAAKPQSSDAAK